MTKRRKQALFEFSPFSAQQLKVLTWWTESSPFRNHDAIICDGSIRAGKTIVMSLSFVMWAMTEYDGENFGVAGKTIGSFRRNVFQPLRLMLKSRGYQVVERRNDNMFIVRWKGVENYFYIFGGKDESSQNLIQGITLAGFLGDEVALMPQSFVNQATARCSIEGAKVWLNCNPEGPHHWLKTDWIDQRHEKRALRLHFTMDDNPSLSQRVKDRYERLYTGVFYQRFILGEWVLADGIVYDMFDAQKHVKEIPSTPYDRLVIGIDYGTSNPTSFVLKGVYRDREKEGRAYDVLKEYYYDGRENVQRTDEEHYRALEEFAEGYKIDAIYLDPSAASFGALIRQRGKYSLIAADNEVIQGIRHVASAISDGRLTVSDNCPAVVKEFSSYSWDPRAQARGEDKPVKEHDHALDAIRYVIYTIENTVVTRIRNVW